MNPVVLGAIIGAVPGTLAAGLSAWATGRAARASLVQTQLTSDTEHQQWLRDKRSEIYVDLLRHAEQLFVRRHTIVNRLDEITDHDRQEVQAVLDEYDRPDHRDLVTRADAYAPKDTAEMFGGMVCIMDFGFWVIIKAKIADPCPRFEVDSDVRRMWNYANEGLTILRSLASRDLQTLPSLSLAAQPGIDETDPFEHLRELVKASRAATS